ncbi:LLM class flavin-dependent oxidoreductase [Limoniibacter endophyticus]|uniref:Luciferase n=1 Tax=Limoniibacter endophyticus TaxID=1565040 RepID=A0A8J3DNB3_9HYPH|nr:LLM class flavin-dependent oxidoreductase [Limoniibacter endophyticus]GHC67303.1 luciferase [Limoniibacter endophyticus]
MEFGLYTFGDVALPGAEGVDPHQRMLNLMEEIELADQVGLDVFGLGEHHRPDYAISAPAVALAGAATRTKKIKLSSAVTVLSSDDPVRVFQQFSTLDLLSSGRAEIIAGRGSFIESYPLFGYNLEDYDLLFAEKLELLMQINESEKVTWQGQTRGAINNRGVYPRPLQKNLPLWIAVGGTPASAARAGALGLPLALAIIGGQPRRFAPLLDLYRQAARRTGQDETKLKTSINVHGFVAETSQGAREDFYLPQKQVMDRIGQERGWGPSTRAQYDASTGPEGAIFIGSPEELAEKIIAHHKIFKNDRFVIQMAIGNVPHTKMMKAIELYGTRVAPMVRKEIGAVAATA